MAQQVVEQGREEKEEGDREEPRSLGGAQRKSKKPRKIPDKVVLELRV